MWHPEREGQKCWASEVRHNCGGLSAHCPAPAGRTPTTPSPVPLVPALAEPQMGFSHIWWDPEHGCVLETTIPLGCDGSRAGCPAVPIPIAPFKSALQCTAIKQWGFHSTKSCTFLRRLVAFPGGAGRLVGFPLPWRKLRFGPKNCAVVLLQLQ